MSLYYQRLVDGLPPEVLAQGDFIGMADEEPPQLVPDDEEAGEGEGDDPPLWLQWVDAEVLGYDWRVDEEGGHQGLHHQRPVQDPVAHPLLYYGGLPGLRDDQVGPLHLQQQQHTQHCFFSQNINLRRVKKKTEGRALCTHKGS
jgi:hypothetical protein